MSLRQNLACHATPVFLRVALGVTFIWAGLGKVMERFPVQDQQTAEALVEAGALDVERARLRGLIPPATPEEEPPFKDESPADPAPPATDPDPDPAEDPGQDPSQDPGEDEGATEPPASADPPNGASGPATGPEGGPNAAAPAHDHTILLASDPNDSIEMLRVFGLSVLIVSISETREVTEDDLARYNLSDERKAELAGRQQRFPLVPEALGNKPWPVALAWAAAITEIVAGLFLLIGFITRLSALGVVGVMVGAIWMTEIGPAMQAGATMIGFLPAYEVFSPDAWKTLLWQFALLMMGLGVAFSGAGGLSLDRVLFGPVGGAEVD
ncbi:MAG: DoxX family protein [Phycisphaerales bacterium]|nr:DoxX family protein [Phycisphaerales bacterium]